MCINKHNTFNSVGIIRKKKRGEKSIRSYVKNARMRISCGFLYFFMYIVNLWISRELSSLLCLNLRHQKKIFDIFWKLLLIFCGLKNV